jgi:hypothetical protein
MGVPVSAHAARIQSQSDAAANQVTMHGRHNWTCELSKGAADLGSREYSTCQRCERYGLLLLEWIAADAKVRSSTLKHKGGFWLCTAESDGVGKRSCHCTSKCIEMGRIAEFNHQRVC